jgi:hypothetical protein
VTEAEWLAETDPLRLLGGLRGRAPDRKLRLFACAGCRRLWWLLRDPRSRTAVEVSERYADGLASSGELVAAARGARQAADEAERARAAGWNAARSAAVTAERPRAAAERVAGMAAFDADLLRHVLGNPFRPPPPLAPSVLGWSGGTVKRLAEGAYEQRDMPAGTFDPARLAVLADALEEAGCTDAGLLGHLRGPGTHVRGCWAVDLILGKR